MPFRLRTAFLALLLCLALAAPAGAWSYKEHIFVTRVAVQRLLADPETPEEMKTWLREIAPTAGDAESARKLLVESFVGPEPVGLEKLDYWVCFPDMARKIDGDKPVAHFGVGEFPMHFVDLELLLPGADVVKQYKHDLSNKPRLEDLPRDWRDPRLVQAGYLPWRVEQVYHDLVRAIREGRLTPTGVDDRDNALVLAGYLAHYLGDNTQPQHATIDFRSRAYFAIGNRAPDVHGMLEYGMLDMEGRPYPELREELWAMLAPLSPTGDGDAEPLVDGALLASFGNDPWESTAKISLYSYDALPLVGMAAQEAAQQAVEEGDPARPVGAPGRMPDQFDVEAFFRFEGPVRGREMRLLDVKAAQLSLATLRVESMLRQAWDDAQRPATTTRSTTRSTTRPVPEAAPE